MQITYPDPNNANPSTRDSLDVGEAPVTVGGNDGRDELGDAESDDEGSRGALHEEETVGTGGEDQGLRDDGYLEVDNHVQLWVVGIDREARELNAKGVLEEAGLLDDANEGDTRMNKSASGLPE